MTSRHNCHSQILASIALVLLTAVPSAPALAEITVKEIKIPMTVKGVFSDSHIQLAATEYKPEGDGPFPQC